MNKKKQQTTGQEFKDTLELIFKYRVNMGKQYSMSDVRKDYQKRGVTEEMFREQIPKLIPELPKEDLEMLAQVIFRPTQEDFDRGN